MNTQEQAIKDLESAKEYSKEFECEVVPFKDAKTIISQAIQTERESWEPEMNRKLQATMMWIAEYAYRMANPNSKMDVPSIVYEQVARDFGRFWDSLSSKEERQN